MNPLEHPAQYDFIELEGVRSPGAEGRGYCEVIGLTAPPPEWDKKKGQNASGATIVFSGEDLSEFSVKFYACHPSDFAEWESFLPLLLRPPDGTKPKAKTFKHPEAAALGITAVVVQKPGVTQWSQVGHGLWMRECKFLQHREAKPAGGKPQGAKGQYTENKKDEYDKTIEDLTKQVKELG